MNADGSWRRETTGAAQVHKFEIQTRFNDSLSAPYWRAYWGTLPLPESKPALVANAIRRYNLSARPGYLHAFLAARTHAMRWVEENILSKSHDIEKPGVVIASLPTFTLGVDNLSRAATDFLSAREMPRIPAILGPVIYGAEHYEALHRHDLPGTTSELLAFVILEPLAHIVLPLQAYGCLYPLVL